ncbi:unnamed protein product [Mytilus edulis]|uniref:Uncharacterized protein n=1 Tax=Mytilus edulis TaxID=6550 RepID=A0A8S3Q9P4_MYTED|nr:unnamed protein product [Mytilus edulis]
MFNDTAENVLGIRDSTRKRWISDTTWNVIEKRRSTKSKCNQTRSERLKVKLQIEYSELNKEVKKKAKEDKLQYIEGLANEAEEACKQENLALYIRLPNNNDTPVFSKNGEVLTSEAQKLERWAEHFWEVLNREPPDKPAQFDNTEAKMEIDISEEKIELSESIMQAQKCLIRWSNDRQHLDILECKVPAEYGNVRVQVWPMAESVEGDLICYFDQSFYKEPELKLKANGSLQGKLSTFPTYDSGLEHILMWVEKYRVTELSLVFDKKQKDPESFLKTVKENIFRDESDRGYLEVVKIFVEESQLNSLLTKPPKGEEKGGIIEYFKKKQELSLPQKHKLGNQQQQRWALKKNKKTGIEYIPLSEEVCKSIAFSTQKGQTKTEFPHKEGIWIYDAENNVCYDKEQNTVFELVKMDERTPIGGNYLFYI